MVQTARSIKEPKREFQIHSNPGTSRISKGTRIHWIRHDVESPIPDCSWDYSLSLFIAPDSDDRDCVQSARTGAGWWTRGAVLRLYNKGNTLFWGFSHSCPGSCGWRRFRFLFFFFFFFLLRFPEGFFFFYF